MTDERLEDDIPLTDDEVRAALGELPNWAGSGQALVRTVTLPISEMDRLLEELGRLRERLGRAARVSRPDPETATLVLRTSKVRGVTTGDLELARQIEETIEVGRAVDGSPVLGRHTVVPAPIPVVPAARVV
ncbi:MAG: 4a-hydroxytetrahydrobiopterin dehydratase [Micromonosporaceae bacterium]|nr:4a-hydroxytetrahydrobiopterin dehydratase [Micromonosporaceae bacterium]